VHCRTDNLHIAALTIRALLHGHLHISAQLPSEILRSVSAEKGKFSVSRSVYYGHLSKEDTLCSLNHMECELAIKVFEELM